MLKAVSTISSIIIYIQHFTTVVDWPEIGCLMEVYTMFYSCRYCVLQQTCTIWLTLISHVCSLIHLDSRGLIDLDHVWRTPCYKVLKMGTISLQICCGNYPDHLYLILMLHRSSANDFEVVNDKKETWLTQPYLNKKYY